jgi:hypothetical protein
MRGICVFIALSLLLLSWTEARMEAIFKGLVKRPDGEGIESLKLEYSEQTKQNMEKLFGERTNALVEAYCKGRSEPMFLFTKEHGPQFNVTGDGVDIHNVSMAILDTLDKLPVDARSFQAFEPTLKRCRNATTTLAGKTEKHRALLALLCVTTAIEKERETLNGIEIIWRWSVDAKMDAALQDFHATLACPQTMTRLALFQLDVEYKRDGVVKAHEAGAISKEQMDGILASNPVPSRGDYLRHVARGKITAASAAVATPDKKDEL